MQTAGRVEAPCIFSLAVALQPQRLVMEQPRQDKFTLQGKIIVQLQEATAPEPGGWRQKASRVPRLWIFAKKVNSVQEKRDPLNQRKNSTPGPLDAAATQP